MNWIEHEYFVPVLIGNDKNVIKCAKMIKKKTGISPHIFADSFSLLQKMNFKCHRVFPWRFDFLSESLITYAKTLEKHCFPVIIKCNNITADYFASYGELIETYYLAVEKNI